MRSLTFFVAVSAALLCLTGCVDAFKKNLERRVRHSAEFAPVDRTISLNPELNQTLGAPITIGELTVASYDPDRHSASIDLPVSGPKGKGHAVIRVSEQKDQEGVVCEGGDFFPEKGPPVHLPPR